MVALVVIMYLGFFASNLVLGGQALHARFEVIGTNTGILLVGAISVIATVFGYRLIHGYTRVMSWLSGAVLLISFVWLVFVHGLPADLLQRNENNIPGFLGALSIAALWQLAYAPTFPTTRATCRRAPVRALRSGRATGAAAWAPSCQCCWVCWSACRWARATSSPA